MLPRVRSLELPHQVHHQEPMVVDEAEERPEEVVSVQSPTFDLEIYAAQYVGYAKLNRLLFIADRCPPMRIEALRLAMDHVKGTLNVNKYQVIFKKLCEALQDARSQGFPDSADVQDLPQIDTQWVDSRLKQVAVKTEKLDNDLKNYKANSIKESIRRGTDDLGDHYLDCGDLNNALRAFARARDYCTSGRHVIDYCLNVTRVSVYLQYWQHIESYVTKAENTPEFIEATSGSNEPGPNRDVVSPAIVNRFRCCKGLAHLASKKYKKAALHFLQINAYSCDFPDIMAAKDIAVYAGLCALASFNRAELSREIINQQNSKQFLELDPQLRDTIQYFYESRYGKCLALLDSIRDNLLLDIYLAPHVSSLYSLIRKRAWIQYFSPYISADMNRMASAFNTTVRQVEEEIMQLILDNQIQARIDSHNKIVHAKDVDQRTTTFQKCVEIGKELERKTRALMLRATLIKHHVIVKCPPRLTTTVAMNEDERKKRASAERVMKTEVSDSNQISWTVWTRNKHR
ncbi:COP9 signalosome complex subunit 1 [Galendromus occidentalis]|uniref:COP9 signalosome complex subunit 1 n=1 Tax=Galendromus occidentalis TaxID=34638 RepID=A0AAJ6QWU2_9ACAR|nr:COP9 signalosome complex subunit 1 [Galendromus occidentalis]